MSLAHNKHGEVYGEQREGEVLKVSKSLTPEKQAEVTRAAFDRDEQLAALMEQVEAISKKLKVDLTPRFAAQLAQRDAILSAHKQSKAKYDAMK